MPSTCGSRQSDEPFSIRDVQFDDPKIIVLALATIAIIPKFLRFFKVLQASLGPGTATVGLWHSFICFGWGAAGATNDKQSPGIAFAFCDDRRETTRGFDGSNQPGNFDMSRKPPLHRITFWPDIRADSTAECAIA